MSKRLKRLLCTVWGVSLALGGVSFAQIGQFSFFASSFCPTNWIVADGRNLSSTTALGKSICGYASGCATNNPISVPNVGGKFLRGVEIGQTIDSGRLFGTSQEDSFQGHFHSNFRQAGVALRGTYNVTNSGGGTLPVRGGTGTEYYVMDPITDGVNGTPRTSVETRPVNLGFLVCIRSANDDYSSGGGNFYMSSTMTIVSLSTQAAADFNPGIWKNFTGGDLSFWFGTLVGFVILWGFKAGGLGSK